MTEGISKEDLLRLKETMPDGQSKLFIHLLIKKCTELDHWLPVDESTPKNRKLILYISDNKSTFTGRFNTSKREWVLEGVLRSVIPTHWKELPEDPKPHKQAVSE